MGGSLAIVAYRSLNDGQPSGSIDLQVRWFATTDTTEIRATLLSERYCRYPNDKGEEVSWELVEILEIEPFAPKESGDEVIGIITTLDELSELA